MTPRLETRSMVARALRFTGLRLCLFLPVTLLALEAQSLSQVYIPNTIAPLEEVSQYWLDRVEQAPDDARAYVQLGRIHCFAYAFGRTHFVVDDPTSHYGSPGVIRERALVPLHTSTLLLPASAEQLNHLAKAIRWLREGLRREPNQREGLLLLGYAYVEAAKRCRADGWVHNELAFDRDAAKSLGGPQYWEDEALGQFRKALADQWAENPPRPGLTESGILVHLPDGSTTRVEIAIANELEFSAPSDFDAVFIHQILSRRSGLRPEETAEIAAVQRDGEKTATYHGLQWPRDEMSLSERPAELIARAEALYPAVEDRENRALHYTVAFDAAVYFESPLDVEVPFFEETPHAQPPMEVSDTVTVLIEKLLACHKQTFQRLRSARDLPKCRYPIDLWQWESAPLKHLPDCRNVAKLGALRVYHLSGQGDSEATTEALLDLTALGQSLMNEPTTVSQFVRLAVFQMAVSALESALNRGEFVAPDLLRIQQSLENSCSLDGYRAALKGELWSGDIPIPDEHFIRDIVFDKVIDLYAPDAEATITEEDLRLAREPVDIKLNAEQTARIDYFQKLFDYADQSLPALYQFADSREGLRLNTDSGTVPGLAASGRFTAATITHIARVRTALAALAVQRYLLTTGELPPDLGVLVPDYIAEDFLENPFTGERLKYSVSDDQFVIHGAMDTRLDVIGEVRIGENASAEASFTVLR